MCDVIGKFAANGTTKVETRKLEISYAPRWQCTLGNIPVNSADVIKWHWRHCIKNFKF